MLVLALLGCCGHSRFRVVADAGAGIGNCVGVGIDIGVEY